MLSNQKAQESTNLSNSFINKTIIKLNKNGSDSTESFSLPIRKMAHLTEYLILGILVFNLLRVYGVKNILLYSLLICIFYSCTDEFHQLFVIGRSCEIRDIFIDSIGSFLGILTIALIDRRNS